MTTTINDVSQKRLSEVCRHLIKPAGIVSTGWPAVRDTCEHDLGIEFDGWQQGAGSLLLAERADGKLAHTIGGVGMSLPRQVGKCLSTDTELLTANRGWTTMGDVQIGDLVFSPSGRQVEVVWRSPLMYEHDCYEVTTTDGRSVVADADHLWEVTDKCAERSRGPASARIRRFEKRIVTTEQMAVEGVSRYRAGSRTSTTDGVTYRTNEYRFVLPEQKCLQLPGRDLPIDPYLLGAWLGNGTRGAGQITFGDQDIDHWVDAINRTGFIPTSKRDVHDGNTRWSVGVTCEPGLGRHARSFVGKLRQLDVLNDKHIPDVYLLGSVDQRLAMLQGLLDTDGHIDRRGVVEFCSMTRNLADGVLFLTRSLGWRSNLHEGKAKLNGRDYGIKYRVCFTPKLTDGHIPFRLPRKAERVGATDGGKGRFTVSIKSIEPVASRPVRCIKIAAPDGLFLAGRDLVATHNTYLLAGTIFGMCIVYPQLLVIWSAHHSKTHMETFLSMQGFAKRSKISPFIDKVYTGSGDEEIRFINGSRILFGARERGFGRGIPGVDVLIMDEGQILSERAMQNMLATLNTSRFGMHIYCGTPPYPEDNSEAFTRMRDEALSGESIDVLWIECGAAPDVDIDDPKNWVVNPSYPYRTPPESILRMRKKLNEEGFKREALGIWPLADESVFDIARWATLADVTVAAPGQAVLMLDVSPDRRWSSIGVAGEVDDGRTLVMTYSIKGTQDVVPRVQELLETRVIEEVAFFGGGSARVLEPAMVEAGIDYVKLTASDMAAAYGFLQQAIKEGSIVHLDQPELNMALANTKTRFLQTGEAESFDRRGQHIDISPAVAASGALYRWSLIGSPMPVII